MDHLHAEMDEDGKESAMAWMQFLSGQTIDGFNFGEWAMVRIVPNLNLA